MKKELLILIAAVALLLVVILVLLIIYIDNETLGITQYNISDPEIPDGFDGYRIAQVADLHNTEFGDHNEALLNLLAECEPDIIVFTGDQADSRKTDLDVVVEFAKQALLIAPCYLVTGNHEGSIPETSELNTTLKELGVTVLEDEMVTLHSAGDTLSLIGVDDPTRKNRFLEIGQQAAMDEALASLCPTAEGYSILLSHRPEYLELYAKYGVDLVLSGHAHGGQLRIAGQGIFDPHQGLFPKYDAGLYTMENTTLVLSRGLGNSVFPWRINNPPELVVVELHSEQ